MGDHKELHGEADFWGKTFGRGLDCPVGWSLTTCKDGHSPHSVSQSLPGTSLGLSSAAWAIGTGRGHGQGVMDERVQSHTRFPQSSYPLLFFQATVSASCLYPSSYKSMVCHIFSERSCHTKDGIYWLAVFSLWSEVFGHACNREQPKVERAKTNRKGVF